MLNTATTLTGPWTCNVCGEEFTTIKAHVDHMGSHSSDFPQSCALCLSRFKIGSDLLNHICAANNKLKNHTPPISVTKNCTFPAPNPIVLATSVPDQVVTNSEENPVKAAEAPVLNTNLATISTSSEPSASLFEDGSDTEESFEAAQNPARHRSRSSSLETNNNHSFQDKDAEFYVIDPLHACSAVVDIDVFFHDASPVVPPVVIKQNQIVGVASSSKARTGSTSSQSSNELIYSDSSSTSVSSRQRLGKRLRIPNSRYFNQDSLPILPYQLQPSNTKLTMRVEEVDPPNRNISTSASSVTSSPVPARESVQGKMAEHVAIPLNPPALPLNPPPLDLLDIVHGHGNFNFNIANEEVMDADEFVEEEATPIDENSNKSFPLYDLKCVKCDLTFLKHKEWKMHVIRKHMQQGAFALVALRKLNVIEVGPYKIAEDALGNVSYTPKNTETCDYSEEDEQPVSDAELSSNSSEVRKEGLKLTLCRRKGQYELKRKSTDAESSSSSWNDESSRHATDIIEIGERMEISEPAAGLPPASPGANQLEAEVIGNGEEAGESGRKVLDASTKISLGARLKYAVRSLSSDNELRLKISTREEDSNEEGVSFISLVFLYRKRKPVFIGSKNLSSICYCVVCCMCYI